MEQAKESILDIGMHMVDYVECGGTRHYARNNGSVCEKSTQLAPVKESIHDNDKEIFIPLGFWYSRV